MLALPQQLSKELDPEAGQGEVGQLLISLLPSIDAEAVIEVVRAIGAPTSFHQLARRAAEAVVRMPQEP